MQLKAAQGATTKEVLKALAFKEDSIEQQEDSVEKQEDILQVEDIKS